MASNPFESKDTSATENTKPKMDYHRQMMENKLRGEGEGKSSQSYVSPSDAIMSPASQKLSGFKQRQMNKQPVKPRSLFAKTTTTTREKDLGPEDDEENKAEGSN